MIGRAASASEEDSPVHLGNFIRKISPLLVLGMGVCMLKERRRRWRARCRKMEERQEEMLKTLHEIRDAVTKDCGTKSA